MIVMKQKILLLLIVTGILGAVSCTKDWEELNTDPNNPISVPPTNILAQAIRYSGDRLYNAWFSMNNTGSYAGHVSKIQYMDEARYFEREGVINNNWYHIYTTLQDLKNAKKLALEEDNQYLYAACLTFESFLFQIATDTWRDIPFTQACRAADADQILNPAYDTQEMIYPALIDSLKKANEIFNLNRIDVLGDGDLLFGGDVSKWQKFANSLRLRMAVRASGVSNTGTIAAEIIADPATYPIMASNEDNAFLIWPGAAPYKEPWFEDSETRDDHAVCKTLVDHMLTKADPRLPIYAHPAQSDGQYRGVVAGESDANLGDIKQYSRIGARFRDNAAGFTPFMRYAEVLFLVAEVDPSAATYEAGIRASMEENGIEAADIDAYIAANAFSDVDDIYYEKWVALFKQSHEAWAETRRTGVPALGAPPPEDCRFPNHNVPPFRHSYPTNELKLNSENVAPYNEKLVDKFWGQQMWWDTRTNVY
ncbi:MAG: SusD/RagB family nutrient-binding outer membrane lipoprotein [Bacteroidetes bacterium]|nr:MAG: SusD/RagB family nutrient-binding outer membrane lipoprotein [Bacteroidota bacterium]PIE88469.1 MAG: SusD/RagB family nutrient-binding outer membrane lipoprotein [Bacteroidota bacterium]